MPIPFREKYSRSEIRMMVSAFFLGCGVYANSLLPWSRWDHWPLRYDDRNAGGQFLLIILSMKLFFVSWGTASALDVLLDGDCTNCPSPHLSVTFNFTASCNLDSAILSRSCSVIPNANAFASNSFASSKITGLLFVVTSVDEESNETFLIKFIMPSMSNSSKYGSNSFTIA